jgi:predicted amidophosphoribosyltransferase
MTRLLCPSCRLRFTAVATATLTTCPDCGRPLDAAGSAETTLGYRLFAAPDAEPALPTAVEAVLAVPGVTPDRS